MLCALKAALLNLHLRVEVVKKKKLQTALFCMKPPSVPVTVYVTSNYLLHAPNN